MKTGQAVYGSRPGMPQRGFDTDEPLLNYGFRSYIDLPLIKQGQLIGTIKFLSREKAQLHGRPGAPVAGHCRTLWPSLYRTLWLTKRSNHSKNNYCLRTSVLQEEIVERSIYEEIVGSSGSLQKVVTAIEQVAPTVSTVLITGETGTGKSWWHTRFIAALHVQIAPW